MMPYWMLLLHLLLICLNGATANLKLRGWQQSSSSTPPPPSKWTFTTGTTFVSSPAISHDGAVVFLGAPGAVYAIGSEDGEEQWRFDGGDDTTAPQSSDGNTSHVIFGSPAVSKTKNGTVVFVGADNNVTYALDAAEGSVKWRFTCGGPVKAAPAASQDGRVVFVSSLDTRLYALDAENGTQLWNFSTRGYLHSTARYHQDSVFLTSTDRALYRLNATTGDLIWRFTTVGDNTTGGDIFASPAMSRDGSVVYLASDDYNLTAHDVDTGEVKWNYTTGSFIRSTPVVDDDDNIYFGSFDRHFYALSPEGELRWRYYTQGYPIASSPTLGTNATVYFGANNSVAYCFNTSTGEEIWNKTLGDAIESKLVVSPSSDEILYVQSNDGTLTAIGGAAAPTPQGMATGGQSHAKAIIIAAATIIPVAMVLLLAGINLRYPRIRYTRRRREEERSQPLLS